MKFSVNYVCEQTRRLELFRYSAVKPLLWDTSIQGLSPFWGHKIWSQENVHILFVSAAYVGGGIVFVRVKVLVSDAEGARSWLLLSFSARFCSPSSKTLNSLAQMIPAVTQATVFVASIEGTPLFRRVVYGVGLL